jgi:hypothetical protein
MNVSHKQPEPISKTAKKAYDKPKLQIYGDLREITKVVGTKGNNDGPPQCGNSKCATGI